MLPVDDANVIAVATDNAVAESVPVAVIELIVPKLMDEVDMVKLRTEVADPDTLLLSVLVPDADVSVPVERMAGSVVFNAAVELGVDEGAVVSGTVVSVPVEVPMELDAGAVDAVEIAVGSDPVEVTGEEAVSLAVV